MFSLGRGKGKKHDKHQLTISQGEKGALFVTLPSEDSDSRSLTRTSEATGSRNNLTDGKSSNPSKRAREDSKGDTNPEKKLELDKNDSLKTAAPSGSKNEVEICHLYTSPSPRD